MRNINSKLGIWTLMLAWVSNARTYNLPSERPYSNFRPRGHGHHNKKKLTPRAAALRISRRKMQKKSRKINRLAC